MKIAARRPRSRVGQARTRPERSVRRLTFGDDAAGATRFSFVVQGFLLAGNDAIKSITTLRLVASLLDKFAAVSKDPAAQPPEKADGEQTIALTTPEWRLLCSYFIYRVRWQTFGCREVLAVAEWLTSVQSGDADA